MNNGGIQIRMSDLLFALQKHWKGVVAATVLGLVFGLMLSGMTYVQSSFQNYEVSGSVAITTLNAAGRYISGESSNNNDFHLAEDMVDAVRYVITSDQVMEAVINDQKMLGITVDQIRKNISISQFETTQILELKLTWRNAEEGVDIWNALVTATNRALPQTLQLGTLAVVNPPVTEAAGAIGSSTQTALLLTALGFAAGIGYALMDLLVHPTLNNVRDVEPLFGLETLGTIPRVGLFQRKENILSQDESSEIVQSYSAAAYILRNRLGGKEKHHCFYVTSSNTREGKSIVAANLAVQLSNMECKTLLIDFDTRNPSLGAMFLSEVDYARSLNALYRGEATEQDVIIHVTGHLDLLPTVLEHKLIPLDGTIEDLITRLQEQYEYIIIDSAPVGIVSDTLSLNKVTDNALFVLGYDNATITEIQSSIEKMDKSGVRVLGCIVNGVSQRGGNKDEYSTKVSKKQEKRRKKKEESFVKGNTKEIDAVEALTKPAGLPAAPAKEAVNAKPGRASKASAKKKAQNRQSEKPVVEVVTNTRRNVLGDLMQPAKAEKNLSDRDAMSALLELGFEGDWNDGDRDNKKDETETVKILDEKEKEEQEPEEEPVPVKPSKKSSVQKARPVEVYEDEEEEEDEEEPVPVKPSKKSSVQKARPVEVYEDEEEEEDEEEPVPVKPSKKSSVQKARPVEVYEDEEEEEDEEEPVPVKPSKKSSVQKARPVEVYEEEEEEEDEEEPVPVKPSKKSSVQKARPVEVYEEEEEEEDEEEPVPVKPSKKSSVQKARPVEVYEEEEEEEDEEEPVPVKPSKKSSAKKARPVEVYEEEEEEEDEEEPVSVKPSKKSSAKKARPIEVYEEEEEEEDEEEPVPVKPSKKSSAKKARPVEVYEEEEEEEDEEEPVPVKPSKKSSAKKARPVEVYEEEEEEEDEKEPVPVKSSKKSSVKKARPVEVYEEEEEEEDEEEPVLVKTSKKSSVKKARPVEVYEEEEEDEDEDEIVPVRASKKSSAKKAIAAQEWLAEAKPEKSKKAKANAAQKNSAKKGGKDGAGSKSDAGDTDHFVTRMRLPIHASDRLWKQDGRKSSAAHRGITPDTVRGNSRRADAGAAPNGRRADNDVDGINIVGRGKHDRTGRK